MTGPAYYRFAFGPGVPLGEAEMTLHLSMLALEGLYGRAAVRLDGRYFADEPARALVVAGGGDVGRALVRVFASLLAREFGEDGFSVGPACGLGEARGPGGDAGDAVDAVDAGHDGVEGADRAAAALAEGVAQ